MVPSLFHFANNRVFEIEPGKTAIEVGKLEDLPAVLTTLRVAIIAGELDERLKLSVTRLKFLDKIQKKPGKPTLSASFKLQKLGLVNFGKCRRI